jgi:hypothetical protein
VDHSIDGMRRDIVELERRILMQRRANWRAVLPHALANHLAERALEEIPGKRIREQIVNSGNARLLRSFTRRLSYLHTHGIAREFCEEWLKPGGMLADVRKLDSFGCDMFNYAASVTPAYALAALERVGNLPRQEAIAIWDSFAEVLRSIAYDAALFDRCVALLLHVISHRSKHPPDHIRTLLVSFFQISHSGTHAPVIKRFGLISDWLTSATPAVQELGKVALQQALSAQISVRYGFTFGARSRDFGYAPRTPEESADWYRHGLLLLDQLKSEGGKRAEFARHLLAKTFPRLWGYQLLRGDLTSRMRSYTNGSFWMEGLAACRHALAKYAGDDISKAELEDLYSQLSPNDLTSKVLALLARSGPPFNGRQPGESQQAYSQRTCESSESLGEQVADNPNVLARVAPMIFRTGDQYERFGLGLGKATPDLATTWRVLMNAWSDHPRKRDPALLCGFLAAMALRDTTLAQQCLNECLTDGSLTKALPAIQNALGWDEAGIARLSKATDSNSIPVKEYRHLYGAARAPAPVRQAATDLLTKIAAVPHGFIVAAQVLNMWHAVAEINGPEEVDYLRPVSREVLRYAAFDNSYGADYDLGLIAELALAGSESESLAQELIWKLRRGAQRNWWPTSNRTLLETLFRLHPMATLTALYEGKKEQQEAAIELLSSSPISSGHPAKLLDPTVLAAWCDADKAKRSAFAIEIIPIVEPAKTSGLAHLTLHARTLLEKCPSPEILLDRIVERLLKRGWDSLSVMESNATALDDMLDMFDAHFRASVQRNKTQLLEKLAAFREQETQRHRVRDERFE